MAGAYKLGVPSTERHVGSHPLTIAIDRARVEAALAAVVPRVEDRAFLARCMLDEGPIHHRGDNYVLVALLGEVLARLPAVAADPAAPPAEVQPVPMRLPPSQQGEARNYPIGIPLAVLAAVDGGSPRRRALLADCLADGPPHHAIANAAMTALLAEILRRLPVAEAPCP